MAAVLAGEAAIRIVPSLAGFKTEADRRLKAYKFDPISVRINPDLALADAEMAKWRALQERNALNINVKTDTKQLLRDLSTVEHIFKRSALSQAIRLNVKVIGLDALPALAYAAGSAASGLDALGKSAFVLPGLLGGALSSVAAFAIGMHGVSDALKAYTTDAKNAVQNAKTINQDNRQLANSYRDYKDAVRDTTREIQDLNSENRRSSLNVADAVLSVQEAADRLRQGGQQSVLELRRDQLNYLQSIDHLQEVQTKAKRTAVDTADANAKGLEGSSKVADALDQIAKNTEKLNADKLTEVDKALAKMSPNAQLTIEAVHNLDAAWKSLANSVQDNMFKGLDKDVAEVGAKILPGLSVGLSGVASGLNENFHQIFQSIGSQGTQTLMSRIFGDTEGGLKNLSVGMKPLIDGILKLTQVGADFLPRLGDAASKVFARFDAFITRISADGSLKTWIDSGLDALTALGNTAVNIASIVSSISQAFNTATGTQGGFITTLDGATERLANFLKSDGGQADLVGYFQKASEFIGHIGQALKAMRPFFREVVDMARTWSTWVFSIVSGFTQTALWIERNTGVLKPLIALYLSLKTVKPLIDGMTASWRNYGRVVGALGKDSSPVSGLGFGAASRNLKAFKEGKSAVDTATASYSAFGDGVQATTGKVGGLVAELDKLNHAVNRQVNPGKWDPTGSAQSAAARANIDAGVSATTARSRAQDAGIGGTTPLQDRLAAGNAAYVQRLALRNADLLAARNDEMFRAFDTMTGADTSRSAAGIRGGSLRDRLVSQTAAQRDRFGVAGVDESVLGLGPLQGPIRPEPTGRQPQTRGADSAGRRRQNRALTAFQRREEGYLQDSYSLYDPDRKYSDGRSPAPARGAVQGPALPPGFLPPGTTRAPALGKMEGPQLTPEFLRELSAASDEATPKLQSIGDVADKTAGNVTKAGDSSKTATPKVTALGDASKTATPKVTTASTAVKDFGTSASNAIAPVANAGESAKTAGSKLATAGEDAAQAAEKMAGGGKFSLLSAAKNLGAGLLPGALLGGAVFALTALVDKLGEAHRNAADAAKAQGDAEAALAQTLDSTTGAFTAATLQQSIITLSKQQIPGYNDNKPIDINDVLTRLHLDPRIAAQTAADPSQTIANQAQQDNLDEQVRQQVEASPLYRQRKADFDEYGLDSLTLAKAAQGDPTALAKVRDAVDHPHTTTNERGAQEAIRIPDLTALANSLPNQDAFQAGFALRGLNQANVPAGAAALKNSQVAAGHPIFTEAGANFFKDLQPDVGSITKDVSGAGVIQINAPVDRATVEYWKNDPALGFDVSTPVQGSNKRTITIPEDKVDGYLKLPSWGPGYADGGIIQGRGGPREDNIMIKASAGEHIAQVPAVKYYGRKLFDDLNNMRIPKRGIGGFLGGGFKLAPPPLPSPTPPPVAPGGGGLGSILAPPVGGIGGPQVGVPGSIGQLPGVLAGLPSPTPPPAGGPPLNYGNGTSPNIPGADPAADAAVARLNASGFDGNGNPLPVAPSTPTTPPGTPGAPSVGAGGPLSGFRVMPDAAPALPAEAGYTAPATQLQNGQPYVPNLTGNGALPDSKSSAASAANGAPIIPNANILDYEAYLGQQYGLTVGSGADTNHGGTHSPDGAQHSFNRATDLGNADEAKSGQISQFVQQYMADPQKVASTRQLIFRGPDGDYGIINGRRIEGDELQSIFGKDLGDHTDHVHLALEGVPQDAIDPASGYLPGGVSNSFLTDANGGADGGGGGLLGLLGLGGNRKAPTAKDGQKFLKDSIIGIAGQAGTIALEAFGSFFGLDLSYLDAAKQVGNFYLGGDGKGNTGDTALTDAALNYQNQYYTGASTPGNGQLDLGGALAPGADSAWGALSGSDLSKPGQKGGEAYRKLVASIVKSQGPAMGIPPSAYGEWEDALVKQIDTESGGDPFSNNPNDSDGKGGTQEVKGLLNFLPSTFTGLGFPASAINNPSAQVAAAMALTVKHGLTATGGPKVIGQGHGFYADGGMPGGGNAMVSAGEYRSNPKAVAHYGPGLYQMLNSMSLPKGFANGGLIGQGAGTAYQPKRGHGRNGIPTGYGDEAGHIGWGVGAYDSNKPTGGGNFNPGIQIDTSTTNNPASEYDPNRLLFGDILHSIPGAYGSKDNDPYHKYTRGTNGGMWGFADGGFPSGVIMPTIPKIPEIPQIAMPKLAPPAASGGGQSAGPLPLAPAGGAGGGQPGLGGLPGNGNVGPSTGGAPGPGAAAPAPDPGVLPSVVPDIAGQLAGIGTGIGGGGGVGSVTLQPGASPSNRPDARGTLGAAPTSTDHVNPALKGAIKAGAQVAGNIGAAAAQAGSFGMPMPGISQMIQGAADIGGQVVGNVANVFSSLLVGTATGGSTASASGVPLLPARPPTQTGVAPMPQRVHNGDINVTNLDEYKRTQERLDAQQAMPFIGKY